MAEYISSKQQIFIIRGSKTQDRQVSSRPDASTWYPMAVASGPAGSVLAGQVFDISELMTAHARKINNKVKTIDCQRTAIQ